MSGLGDLFRRRTKRLQEFENAVEGVEEMITVIDRDYRYVLVNRAFLNYRGMKRAELLGRNKSQNPHLLAQNARMVRTRQCFYFTKRLYFFRASRRRSWGSAITV